MTLTLPGRYYRMYPSFDNPLGHAEEQLELDPARTGFLIVDAYGAGFDDEEEHPGLAGIYAPDPVVKEIVREHIVPARDAARQAGLPVIHVTNHLSPGLEERTEWRNLSMRTCDVDVLEAWREPNDILAYSRVIAPADGEPLIRKQMYSGFYETTLDSTLRARDIRDLVVVGFDSRICLGNTVTEAMYRGYRVVVLRDCVRTFEYPETRDGELANLLAIRYIESNVGYTATSAEFAAACRGLTA
ncbi:peroxyureidoacrylate/ureidoacrylate amidohydrolase RutB [Acrocarpospora corrugata]|uniref:Peroxyureidoacrylate/ureidoacrylate amidohydrolase RutB n=1 Tax=Acrocarpospora corrugata TaxID=35763 RepID=A0A5M3VRT3_9ACTN|nr:isochorismatase family cysteine hydrolase [Acrocarpospora corrugata]GER99496.1 peroxyureidoacrylate/ureidoacrylate amidohydrolase RutB [Acrocarpospora corrugata]